MKTLSILLGILLVFETFATAEEPKTMIPDDSIYLLDSTWTNQSGKALRLADFRGSPVVLTMFYASCEFSCPITISLLKKIESALSPESKKATRFVLVTFDTEDDTVEALAKSFKKRGLNAETWSFLRGNEDDTRELAVLLGIKYKEAEGGVISHSNIITVLDKAGRVTHRQEGLSSEIRDAVASLKAVTTKHP